MDIPKDCGVLETKITGNLALLHLFPHFVRGVAAPCMIRNAKLSGGFDAWIKGNPQLESQAYNEIKKCQNCGKPCARSQDSGVRNAEMQAKRYVMSTDGSIQ